MDEGVLNKKLVSEACFVIERAFANNWKVAAMFSGGKDSIVLLTLVELVANKLARDYSIVNIDTGKNFPELIDYRNQIFREMGRPNLIEKVDEIAGLSLNRAQSFKLNTVIAKNKFDCVLGGGRRDEDSARSKETFFSVRGEDGSWKPENSCGEIWPWIGLSKKSNEHFRVFPLNNWNEADIWSYIAQADIKVCSLYFSHEREVWVDEKGRIDNQEGVAQVKKNVRFRTIGDMTNSFPIESDAQSIAEILQENFQMKKPERFGRADDQFSRFSMEIRKKEGYF